MNGRISCRNWAAGRLYLVKTIRVGELMGHGEPDTCHRFVFKVVPRGLRRLSMYRQQLLNAVGTLLADAWVVFRWPEQRKIFAELKSV